MLLLLLLIAMMMILSASFGASPVHRLDARGLYRNGDGGNRREKPGNWDRCCGNAAGAAANLAGTFSKSCQRQKFTRKRSNTR